MVVCLSEVWGIFWRFRMDCIFWFVCVGNMVIVMVMVLWIGNDIVFWCGVMCVIFVV